MIYFRNLLTFYRDMLLTNTCSFSQLYNTLILIFVYLFIYSCVPKANCDDLLDVRASGLLCVDASTTCCHQSKIIEASDDYEDEESCASLVDEGWRYSGILI